MTKDKGSDKKSVLWGEPDDMLLALCIYGEARGEPLLGKLAVGLVVRNRVQNRQSTYREIILEPYQFSCFNKDDPNYQKIMRIADTPDDQRHAIPFFHDCLLVANAVIDGIEDFTNGAEFFYAHYIPAPKWIAGMHFCGQWGHHLFWKRGSNEK